jgi:serine/threonine protein kinase/Tol biopolymer transport system component
VALAVGTRLGPYEVLSPLGAGGMGEVYRARDTKLDRDVAVKVLPADLAGDAEALSRLEREARAVAQLSHPNILAIHDFGRQGETAYAVMELLEGETLRARLGHGALPARKAVDLAVQMAEGLAAAHEKGIVHRDLKPENVFVTGEGRVKLLDFGLAKRVDPATGSDSRLQTVDKHTEPGTVMGTVRYMSPEQVRGDVADHRSDIFSFGVVLHEMLTGRQAFKRDTAAESMAAILKEDPPEIAASGSGPSPALSRIVQHCLEKKPGERFQSARDIAFDLGSIGNQSGGRTALPVGGISSRVRVGASIALILLTGMLGVWLVKAPPPPARTIRRLTFGKGRLESARFLPGSRDIVYSARWQGQTPEVFTLHPESLSARPLGVPNAILLSVSRNEELALQLEPRLWDGRSAGRVGRVATTEGGVRILAEQAMEADWLPDGRRLAVLDPGSVGRGRRIDFPEGTKVWETPYSIHTLRVSPKGDKVACFAEPGTVRGAGKVVVLDMAGHRTELADVAGFTGLAWGPDGQDIWFSEETEGSSRLFAISPSGKRRLLLHQAGRLRLLDVARDGRVLASLDHELKGVMGQSSAGGQERDLGWNEANMATQVSVDGTQVLLGYGDDWGTLMGGIYLRPMDGSPAVRVGEGERFALSPDGRWIVTCTSSSASQLSLIPTGPGTPKAIPLGEPIVVSRLWCLPGNQGFLLWGMAPGRGVSLLIVGPEGGRPRLLLEGASVWWGSEPVSPDGRWVAVIDYNPRNVRTGGLKLVRVDGGPAINVRGTQEGDILSGWTADGRGLLLFNRDGLPARMVRLDLDTARRDTLRELMPADPSGISGIQEIQMSRDNRSYTYNYVRRLSDLYLIEGLK